MHLISGISGNMLKVRLTGWGRRYVKEGLGLHLALTSIKGQVCLFVLMCV